MPRRHRSAGGRDRARLAQLWRSCVHNIRIHSLRAGVPLPVGLGMAPVGCTQCSAGGQIFMRRMWPLQMLLLAGVIVILNEGVFKRIIKQDRPSESCLHSKGMPSSHAELSIGFWLYLHLEVPSSLKPTPPYSNPSI